MTELTEVRVPDIGDFSDVPVIEVLVEVGDRIRPEDPLVTLESDKATMDVPAPAAGVVRDLAVAVGDNVSEGSVLLRLEAEGVEGEAAGGGDSAPDGPEAAEPAVAAGDAAVAEPPARDTAPSDSKGEAAPAGIGDARHRCLGAGPARTAGPAFADRGARARAGPAPGVPCHPRDAALRSRARRRPREGQGYRPQGADPARGHQRLRQARAGGPGARESRRQGTGIPPIPAVDFSASSERSRRARSGASSASPGPHLHRSWVNVPHVTNHDEADVTDLEAFRRAIKDEAAAAGVRITLLAFVTKAVAATLGEFPSFNASLSPDGGSIVLKKYVHVGIAVDTPNGLMVPVLRDADRKGVYDLAREMAELGARAREGGLKSDELQGGTFTISSLGGIGGTAFTPIINAPEVAILGLSRTRMTPVWDGAAFQPRLMLPLDLSWDHRVVDGAEAARFLAHLARLLADMRRLVL